jgi:hypothetical protein
MRRPDPHPYQYTFNEVLWTELVNLRPELAEQPDLAAEQFEDAANPNLDEVPRAENLRRLYRLIASFDDDQRLSALCLSGGGIRSATFNLGVLQALARYGLIEHFDYLSTVSGGGYIGGWLKAWMKRAGTRQVSQELSDRMPDQPLKPEPRPVDRLREFSNFLTPRRGLLSGDTWAALAIIIRNLFLNWLIIVPVLMAVAGIPLLYLLAVEVNNGADVAPWAIGLALALALVASVAVHRFRHPPKGVGTLPSRVKGWAVFPLVLSAVFLSLGASWIRSAPIEAFRLLVFAPLWGILLPLFGWSLREPFWQLKNTGRWPLRELLALVGSGLVGTGLLIWVAAGVHPSLVQRPVLYAILGVPILLGIYLLARALFVAFSEGFPHGKPGQTRVVMGALEDADREWWARLSGYIVMSAVGWLIVSTVGFLGWYLASRLTSASGMAVVSGVGSMSGIASVLLGKGADTGSGHGASGAPAAVPWKNLTLAVAAPVFCACVLILLGYLDVRLIRWITDNPTLLDVSGGWAQYGLKTVPLRAVGYFFVLLAVLVVLAATMGLTVNVNRFSLHGLYRNRLVRAYLGASNTSRRPDPFSGFAWTDNLTLAGLWKKATTTADVDSQRPLLLINTTLNLVRGDQLAWQERKAESFSMSPFFCGNFVEGYRLTKEYGGRSAGISLGTALAISGAAANPNMGYHSSPFITFLLGALNARLGAWLGNTNYYGRDSYWRSGPRWAVKPLFAELMGLTDNRQKYVQLSDGGHFDNLGLYEMVLRRCRVIVLSDAGRDPSSGFEDLGNAIRKIRIDFGISVDFGEGIRIVPRSAEKPGLYCAVGTIRYSDVDGCDERQNGTVIYLKPTLGGADAPIPYDVYSYSRAAEQFPHESTADQWFDESQFESYRALGVHVVRAILGDTPPLAGLRALEAAATEYLKKAG